MEVGVSRLFLSVEMFILRRYNRRQEIGVYGDVSRLSGQRYRFSGTGAFLGKEGSFECLRVKSGMKLIICKKVLTVNILHYILLAIAAMDRRKANGNNKITDRRISSGLCQ